MAIDPICGMQADEKTERTAERAGQTFYFCSDRCLQKFMSEGQAKNQQSCWHAPAPDASNPSATGREHICPMCAGVVSYKPGSCPRCGMALEPVRPQPRGTRVFTCPMHSEVEQQEPGTCPKCGMELEPKNLDAEQTDGPELGRMTQRFKVSAAFTVPVFLLAMLLSAWVLPQTGDSRWVDRKESCSSRMRNH